MLVDHLMRKHKREGQKARGLAPDALSVFQRYHWPGNIRELENEIERMLVLGGDQDLLTSDLLSSRIRDTVSGASGTNVIGGERLAVVPAGRLNDAVEQLERDMISQGLQRTRHNKSKLARELGISRSNLILKIQKYALERPGMTGGADDEEAEVNA
jgi:transcriptional regulator with PAS, ATPase and Fis domain